MKIVCGSCGAKYSIADEKVQGKVFKIRCKKCSNVIVVKGTADAEAADEAAPAQQQDSFSGAYGGSAGASEWYVVIDEDQVGPITPEEVEAYFTSGRIEADTYVWREGMGDWQILRDVEVFAHLAADGAGPHDATMVAGSDSFGQQEAPAAAADDDATSVMDAGEFREQMEQREQQAAATASGYDDGYAGYDGGSGAYDAGGSDAYAAADAGGGFDAFGQEGYAEQPAAEQGGYDAGGGFDAFGGGGGDYDAGGYDDAGFGGEPAAQDDDYDDGGYAGFGGASYDDEADMGGGGMFAAFDSADADAADDYSPDFGSADSGSSAGGGGMGGGASAQTANDLLGQRNENSVLFSLSSLEQVEAVSKPANASNGAGGFGAMSGGGGGGGGDAPVTEGSGLIDIQALAATHKSMSKGDDGPDAPGGADPFGAGTMSMPALMPMGSHKSNKGLIIGISVLGLLLVGGIVTAIVLVMNQDKEPQVIYKDAPGQQAGADNAAAGGGDKPPSAEEAAEAAEAEKAAAAALAAEKPEGEDGEGAKAADEKAEEDKEESKKVAAARPKREERRERRRDPKPESKPEPKKSSGGGGIDDIIGNLDKKDDKASGGGGGGGGEAAPAKNVPAKLSRSMVAGTVRKYNGKIHNCYTASNKNKMSGAIKVRYTIQPSGRVSAANVTTSKFKGTDVGKCVEGVVRSMRFPQTKSDLTVNYPFVLR